MTGPAPDLGKLRLNRDTPSRPVRRAFARNLALTAVAVILVGAAVLLLRRGRAVPVQVVLVEASSGGGEVPAGAISVTANGYIVARTRASVAAKLPGRLAQLKVSEGSHVRRGEIIAVLENADFQAQVSQAEATLTTTQAEVLEAEAERDQLRREAGRVGEVHKQNPDLVAQQEVDAAESRVAQAEARVGASAARVTAAQAGLRFARVNLENTFIRAPFTGTVLRKEAEVGEVVAPSVGGSLTRGAVVTMADLTTLEVEVDVNEAYIARVMHDQPARITLDAYPDTAFRGKVRQVVPTADRQRATVQVKVSILDRDPRILPEMGSRVDFLEAEAPAGRHATAAAAPRRIRVPSAAVKELNGKTVVWLVREGRLEPRAIEAGPVSAGFREVRSGLAGGESLLAGGIEVPRPGMRVQAVTP